MSAFMLSHRELSELAFLASYDAEFFGRTAHDLGTVLHAANLESICTRYEDVRADLSQCPGLIAEAGQPFVLDPSGGGLSPRAVNNLARHYCYNACDWPGFGESEAARIAGAAVRTACRQGRHG